MTSMRTKALSLPVALLTAVAVAGCGDDSAGPEQGTTVEDVAEAEPDDSPTESADAGEGDDLLGETVTVSGEITETIDPSGFWLGAGGGLFEEGAPVISTFGDYTGTGTDSPGQLMDSDTLLQVTGTVAELVVADVEDEFGIDLDDETYADLDGEVVILADEITTLAGEDVTIEGEVHELLSTVAFRLVGAGWSVVVLDADQAVLEPGDTAQVTGTVRQMNLAEIESDYGLDLDDALYEPYEGDLVLVADTVTAGETPATD